MLILQPYKSPAQQYRGVREVSHIIRYLKTALRPVSILHNETDLAYKLTEHDVSSWQNAFVLICFDLHDITCNEHLSQAVVLCNLNFMEFREEASVAYNVFYEAARKFSDIDQLNDIAFTVALSPDGSEFGEVTDAAVIHLFLWNETIAYVRLSLS